MSQKPRPDDSFKEEALVLARWGAQHVDEIYVVLHELKKRAPELSNEQIDAVAERVAEKVAQSFKDEKHEAKESRESIKKALRDIAIAIIASGIWELMVYLSTHVLHFDGTERAEPTAEERNLKRVERKLTAGMDGEQVKDLVNCRHYLDETVGSRFCKHYRNDIAQSAFLKDLVAARVKRLGFTPEWIERLEKNHSDDIFEDLYHELQQASMKNILSAKQ